MNATRRSVPGRVSPRWAKCVSMAAGVCATAFAACGGTLTWYGPEGGTWSTLGNWTNAAGKAALPANIRFVGASKVVSRMDVRWRGNRLVLNRRRDGFAIIFR